MRFPTDEEHNFVINTLKRTVTIDKLELIRNAYLTGSALCVTILIAISQIAERPTALQIAAINAALAMPICSTLAYVVHMYIHLGESFLEKYNNFRTNRFYFWLQVIACSALVLSMGSIVYFLHTWALIAFISSCVLGVIFFLYAGYHLTIDSNVPQIKNKRKK